MKENKIEVENTVGLMRQQKHNVRMRIPHLKLGFKV